jgi:hypothetical protein
MTTSFPIDADGDGPCFQFSSLTQSNRNDIVELSANFNLAGAAYIEASTLELSALGATTNLLGQWNPPQTINLTEWHHIAATGRDVYVKIVNRGWLFPLGHQAVLVEVIERAFVPDPVNGGFYADAYLGRKQYVRLLQPTKQYPALGQPFNANDWPFGQVTITTLVSPELDAQLPELTSLTTPSTPPTSTGKSAQALLLTHDQGTAVSWSLVATDLAGNELHLAVPLVFVFGEDTQSGFPSEFDQGNAANWASAYNSLATSYRITTGSGQPLRLAPEAGGPAGGTTHPLVDLTLGAATPSADPNTTSAPSNPPSQSDLQNARQPAFYPVLSSATVLLKAADALSGRSTGFTDGNPNGVGVGVKYFADYVVSGLPEQAQTPVPLNGVYAELTQAAASAADTLLSFPANLVGGLATPNLLVAGISAITGPVGGTSTGLMSYASSAGQSLSSGELQQRVQSYFAAAGNTASLLPQLLGGLSLPQILAAFAIDLPGGLPNLTVTTDGSTVTVRYSLQATLTSFPSGTSTPKGPPVFVPDGSGLFSLDATAVITPTATSYQVNGSITPFTIYLVAENNLQFIVIPFNGLTFSAATGTKTKVDVSIGAVEFTGALAFVETLQEYLNDLGGGALSIAVTPTEVDVSSSISLPPVKVGVFNLSGISFSAGLTVPFLGDPAVLTFGFASQDNPFVLTVSMFGGGGFLALGLGYGQVQTVQASFEFAGQFALDIGVASGGVTLAAGVYYSYDASSGTTLAGFVRLTGELEVLGIVSISAELDLTLVYVSGPSGNYVQGTATLQVTISICFFSASVPIKVTKQFGGAHSSSAPMISRLAGDGEAPSLSEPAAQQAINPISFDQLVPTHALWESYCGAFAG